MDTTRGLVPAASMTHVPPCWEHRGQARPPHLRRNTGRRTDHTDRHHGAEEGPQTNLGRGAGRRGWGGERPALQEEKLKRASLLTDSQQCGKEEAQRDMSECSQNLGAGRDGGDARRREGPGLPEALIKENKASEQKTLMEPEAYQSGRDGKTL